MKIFKIPVGMLQTNCYLIASSGGKAVLIDPGAEARRLIEKIEQEKLVLEQILFTHGHFDHIGAAKEILSRFPVPIAIGKKDVSMLSDPFENLSAEFSRTECSIQASVRELSEGETVNIDGLSFEVLDTPGHTRGGVTYRCENVLFTGDTLFCGSAGRTDFPGGNAAELKKSLQKLALLPGDARVLPGHGETTSLQWERERNPYFRSGVSLL